MSAPTLTDTLNEARARWLRGDARAWARYAECCLRLKAELHKTRSADRSDETSSESEPHPSATTR